MPRPKPNDRVARGPRITKEVNFALLRRSPLPRDRRGRTREQHAVNAAVRRPRNPLAIVGDGELWTWGLNAHGQCGEADSGASDVATPQPGVAAALGGGAVTAVACGARFTAAYSAESHRLAVCGSGAAEFLSSPPPREDVASWREVSLVGVAEELAVSQMDAGDAHLVLLAAPR